MSTDDKALPIPDPYIDENGVGLCHESCPALAHLGNIYQRCLKLDLEVGVRDICGVWAAKAAKALRAMEWLRDMGWEQFRVSVEQPGRWGNPARRPHDAIFAAFEARHSRRG